MNKKPISEQWILYVGRKANKWTSIVFILFTILWFSLYYWSAKIEHLLFGLMWIFLANIWFERRLFYKVIQKQQKEIDELKSNNSVKTETLT